MAKLPLIKTKKTKNQSQTKIINTLYLMLSFMKLPNRHLRTQS